jgi:hypothetical protein
MKQTDDTKGRNYLLNTLINNSQDITLSGQKDTTSTGYIFSGSRILNITNYKKTQITRILFVVGSGTLADGMTVQLYDHTNNTEITTIVFSSAEDDKILDDDVLSYFNNITIPIILKVNIKSASGGSVEMLSSILQIKGKFIDE